MLYGRCTEKVQKAKKKKYQVDTILEMKLRFTIGCDLELKIWR
jgi:hypothetical protein